MYPVAAMYLVLVGAGKDFWAGHMDHALGYDLCMQEILYPRIPRLPHWTPTHRIIVGYSSPVYRKMQLKEAARQPLPSTAREVRTVDRSREKGGVSAGSGERGLGGCGLAPW